MDISRETKKEASQLKKASPGPKSGVPQLLKFLKSIQIPDNYIKNIRRTHHPIQEKKPMVGKKKSIKPKKELKLQQNKKNTSRGSYFEDYDPKL